MLVQCNVVAHLREELDLHKFFDELKIEKPIVGAAYNDQVKGTPVHVECKCPRRATVDIAVEDRTYMISVWPKFVAINVIPSVNLAINLIEVLGLMPLISNITECMVVNHYKIPSNGESPLGQFMTLVAALKKDENFTVNPVDALNNGVLQVVVHGKSNKCKYRILSTLFVMQTSKSIKESIDNQAALLKAIK